MQNFKKTRPFLFSYHHDGATWSVTLHAYDFEDAEARAKKLGNLKLDGELMATIPAPVGFLPKIVCAIRNAFS